MGPDESPVVAMCYIILVWVVWILMLVVSAIFLLNFLIAIVSQSYERLIESEEEALLESQLELNEKFLTTYKDDASINC